MFDTVRLRAYNIMIEQKELLRHNVVKSTTMLDEETGALSRYVQIKGDRIPYINYSEAVRQLDIEVSIPKCLFGENVSMVSTADIDNFFALIKKEMFDMFGVSIGKSEWKGLRTDVCWNFQVGNKVQDYMRQLASVKLPRMNTHVINQVETTMYRNKKKKVMFYDKEQESRDNNCDPLVIERAKGILRVEIQPPDYEMKKYTESRKAVDLLTSGFFKFVTEKYRTIHWLFSNTDDVTFEFVRQHSHKKVEMGIGFQKLKSLFGMGGLKKLYPPSTLDSRQALLKELDMQPSLPPLEIDYDQL